MLRQKAKGLFVLLLGAWLLAACATGAPSTAVDNTAPPPAAQAEAPPTTGERDGNGPVALAYQPADGSLLRADSYGLARWRGGQWESVALPETAPVSGVVVNPEQPETIYVSGLGVGVLRSNDEGATWQAVNTGLPSLKVTALALHSFKREILYAWLKEDGVYRTEDGGATWVQLPDQGPQDKDVRGLVHSTLPGSMNTGWLYASTPSGAYLSMDCF
ncbi:MAG: hypothetical protein DYG89_11510 [Caldilinea sp. CFX5]|nr:hypothetical protein [Caldilinea sp. CFX5]